jgi:hypothetical protein
MIPMAEAGLTVADPQRFYHLYGLRLRSHWSLRYPPGSPNWFGEVALTDGTSPSLASAFEDACPTRNHVHWFHHRQLPNGSLYLRWADLFDFLLSVDGREIAARPLSRSSPEAFHAYLLGQVLSFALIKQGLDPLHATVVVVNGEAVAFLGDCGYGKSSLAAAFLDSGHRLLTDDLLVLRRERGRYEAHPGAPRIKVFPEIAREFLAARSAATPISHLSPKLIIPLDRTQVAMRAAPLKAVYLLAAPSTRNTSERIAIRRLSRRRGCLSVVQNTYNSAVRDSGRLNRQFALASGVVADVPISTLSYPRTLHLLRSVRDAILADLAH